MCVVEYGYASMFCVRQTHTQREREVYVECTGPETKEKEKNRERGRIKYYQNLLIRACKNPGEGETPNEKGRKEGKKNDLSSSLVDQITRIVSNMRNRLFEYSSGCKRLTTTSATCVSWCYLLGYHSWSYCESSHRCNLEGTCFRFRVCRDLF